MYWKEVRIHRRCAAGFSGDEAKTNHAGIQASEDENDDDDDEDEDEVLMALGCSKSHQQQ